MWCSTSSRWRPPGLGPPPANADVAAACVGVLGQSAIAYEATVKTIYPPASLTGEPYVEYEFEPDTKTEVGRESGMAGGSGSGIVQRGAHRFPWVLGAG
jgi:hypothetical protein